MKLKYALLLGVTILVSCDVDSQNETQLTEKTATTSNDLESKFAEDISSYLTAFNNKEWDRVIDMIYPKLFELISRDQMKNVFEQTGLIGMKMNTDFEKIEKLSEVVVHEGLSYCRVFYKGGMTIQISDEILEGQPEFERGLEEYYGKENVSYDDHDQVFSIQANKSMVAILEPDAKSWSYMEYNEQQRQALDMLIPEVALKQLEE